MTAFLVASASVVLILWLVLKLKAPAFLVLLLVAVLSGLLLGMPPDAVLRSVQDGMGGTLGFVAVVVGLGALFGQLLEMAGGIEAISRALLAAFGTRRAGYALGLIGFLVAIPVFFEVAFIMLAPLLFGLAQRTGRPLLSFALPLLAGLLVTHAFVPPTPGPVAAAELLGADLGWVILFGILVGVPAMLLSGPAYAALLSRSRLFLDRPPAPPMAPAETGSEAVGLKPLGFVHALLAIVMPLVLILAATVVRQLGGEGGLAQAIVFLGHPFAALILACSYAFVAFGLKRGEPPERLRRALSAALEPAGVVVLVTGAGGAFKQVLVDSGLGARIAEAMGGLGVGPVLFGFTVAALTRIAQGSATVALITAAGLAAPLVEQAQLGAAQTALVVIAIASGGSLMSHVNDSGFWLVSRYLGLSELDTLRTWTACSTIAGLSGFAGVLLLSIWI